MHKNWCVLMEESMEIGMLNFWSAIICFMYMKLTFVRINICSKINLKFHHWIGCPPKDQKIEFEPFLQHLHINKVKNSLIKKMYLTKLIFRSTTISIEVIENEIYILYILQWPHNKLLWPHIFWLNYIIIN